MSVVPIPGGTATLREELVSERHNRILEAAYMAASAALAKSRGPYLAWAGTLMGVAPEEMTPVQLQEAQKIIDDLSDEAKQDLGIAVNLTQEEAADMLGLQDAAIVAFLENWSLKKPLPTVATVQDLDRDLYRALADATRPLIAKTVVGHEDFSEQPLGDGANPTPSSNSFAGNVAEQDTLTPSSTPESSPSGESTGTEASTPV